MTDASCRGDCGPFIRLAGSLALRYLRLVDQTRPPCICFTVQSHGRLIAPLPQPAFAAGKFFGRPLPHTVAIPEDSRAMELPRPLLDGGNVHSLTLTQCRSIAVIQSCLVSITRQLSLTFLALIVTSFFQKSSLSNKRTKTV